MSKRVLLTGVSGGFGNLSAKSLLQNGHKVVGTMRSKAKHADTVEAIEAAGGHVVELDVTNDNSVNDGVKAAMDHLGGIDVLVNNAGVGVSGMQEHFTVDDFQKVFDVNVFGVQRINRAVIPAMREQGSGLIVYVSSLLGRMTLPFYGPYNASKWALEAMAENYRVELSGFGVDSCIVEPGGFPTTFFEALIKPSDQSRDASYGDFMNAPAQLSEGFGEALAQNPAQNPQLVADAVLSVIEAEAGQRPFRTVVDKMGMGDHLIAYNEQLEQITSGVYNAFQMGDMLKLKV